MEHIDEAQKHAEQYASKHTNGEELINGVEAGLALKNAVIYGYWLYEKLHNERT